MNKQGIELEENVINEELVEQIKLETVTSIRDFLHSGKYTFMKTLELRQSQSKQWMKNILYNEDGKRFEFEKQGYVCKYVVKDITEIDQEGLLDELTNYFTIADLVHFNVLSWKCPEHLKEDPILMDFIEPSKPYVRLNLNKVGKMFKPDEVNHYEQMPDFWYIPSELNMFAQREKRLSELEAQYKLLLAPLLKVNEGTKFEEGSLSVIQGQQKYNTAAVLNYLEEDTFLEDVTISKTAVNELIEMGLLDKTVIEPYIKIVDRRVDFVVQSLESESVMFQYLNKRRELIQARKII